MSDPAQNLLLAEYEWILVVGAFAAFIFGFGTGSNDVANAFGTSVGSKTLTLFKAVLIAIVFEFVGAMVLGRVSQETISGGIADVGAFQTEPEFYAYGMMWALLFGGIWQIYASSIDMNVSATHTIIGAIVGFSMCFKGRGAVIWAQKQIVCSGPLVAYSPCEGVTCAYSSSKATQMMYFTNPFTPWNGNQPLAGTYTVGIDSVWDYATGLALCTYNASILSNMFGLPIIEGGSVMNATWPGALPPGTATSTSGGSSFSPLSGCAPNTPGCVFSATSQTYSCTGNRASLGPFRVNTTIAGSNYAGEVQFVLKTADKDGKNFECLSPINCPRIPQKTAPVIPGQFMYDATAGWCTTGSNAVAPFPPFKGVLIIVLSWFFSPILTGIASAILYGGCRALVLRSQNAYLRSFFVLPFLAFLTFWVDIYFVLTKGAAKMLSREAEGWTIGKAAWISAACAGGIAFLCVTVVCPLMYLRINQRFEKEETDKAAAEAERIESLKIESITDPEKGPEAAAELEVHVDNMLKKYLKLAAKAATYGMTVDIHQKIEEDELVAAIHSNAEVFDAKAESVFAYMQVFSAICVIFAHGAGEVGYMSGPLGAIFQIIRSGFLPTTSSPPIWTVLIGALGLVIGLGTYGYQVTRAVGVSLAKLTPSRGFAAELSTSMVIMIAAQYSLPTSSSQCITGGIIGIALLEGRKGLNFKFLFKTFMSWVWTMLFVALVVGFLFSQGAYAPSAQMGRKIRDYEEGLSVRSNTLLTNYQTMLKNSGYNTGSSSDAFAKVLTQTIANTKDGQFFQYGQNPPGYFPGNKAPVIQTVAPFQMLGYLDAALALISQSIMPNPNGLMMCNGVNNPDQILVNGTYGSNWKATSYNSSLDNIAKFPWAYNYASTLAQFQAVYPVPGARNLSTLWATAKGTALSGLLQGTPVAVGPCTGTLASSNSISLSKVNILIPSPTMFFESIWLDKSGNLVNPATDPNNPGNYGWKGGIAQPNPLGTTYPTGLPTYAPALPNIVPGNVTLDSTANSKTCQQAPCNQIVSVGGINYNG